MSDTARDVGRRISALLAREHAELRLAVDEAEEALADLEQGRRDWSQPERKKTPGPSVRSYGTTPGPSPSTTTTDLPVRRRSAAPLREAWDALNEPLVRHLRLKRELVLPLASRIASGEVQHRSALRTTLAQMTREHEELRSLVGAVLREARLAHPVRNEFERVGRLFDAHLRIEQAEIYPRLLEAETGAAAGPRNANDVGRALRHRTPTPPQRAEAPAPDGLFTRIRRMFGA